MIKNSKKTSAKIKTKGIKKEEKQIKESNLEEELEQVEEEIDSSEFTEFLQQSPEIKSSSPVLEKIASAAEGGTIVFAQEEDEKKESIKELGPKYLESPEDTDNSSKYISQNEEIKYAQTETTRNPIQRVDLMEVGRNPAEIITQKLHFKEVSELKGIESTSREIYIAPKRREVRDVGRRDWIQQKEEQKIKYKSGV